ncbi:hypothetical protein PGT21_034667 [Puccinia graminis f. sp. tritici]|uniref:Uncharacterized protein n=1 Tax=Puccinia graminis f. sp. tritici TaxID=56615 RepID=A0A5B0M9H7_PUCGR|nr:hypothetical protein PGT21_034667 [Puccinia graminis f. sp. tritici]KAA1120287.1 hypothetical protein PGTUg99_007131 [Puccinia graminis f. sp. tritici]
MQLHPETPPTKIAEVTTGFTPDKSAGSLAENEVDEPREACIASVQGASNLHSQPDVSMGLYNVVSYKA